MTDLTVIGTIPPTVSALELVLLGATTAVVHEDRADIEVRSNYEENWDITDGRIEQTKVANSLSISIGGVGGISISNISIRGVGNIVSTGDGRSSMSIAGVAIEIEGDDVFVNGKKQKDAPEDTGFAARIARALASLTSDAMSINGKKIEVRDGVVYVDGKKQVDADEETTATASDGTTPSAAPAKPKSNGPDQLIVAVPRNWTGSLNVDNSGMDNCVIDGWTGGDVKVNSSSSGEFTAAGPLSDIGELTLDISGMGDCALEFPVICREFEANISSSGALSIESGLTADKVDIDGSGMGDIGIAAGVKCRVLDIEIRSSGALNVGGHVECDIVSLDGSGMGDLTFGTMKCREFSADISSSGGLQMRSLDTEKVDVNASGMGDINIKAGRCTSGTVRSSAMGDVTMRGDFDNVKQRSSGMGDVTIG